MKLYVFALTFILLLTFPIAFADTAYGTGVYSGGEYSGTQNQTCGDNNCTGQENCTSCPTDCGNCQSGSQSTGSGGRSGGGGSGGISTSKYPAQKKTTTINHSNDRSEAQISVFLNVTETEINLTDFFLNSIVIIGKPSNKSMNLTIKKNVPAIPIPAEFAVYQEFQIEFNGNITGARIWFNIPRAWIEEQQLEASNISLLRLGGEWQTLKTDRQGEGGNSISFLAYTPGFSSFAIAGRRAPPQVNPLGEVQNETQASAVTSNTTPAPAAKDKKQPTWPWALSAILLAATFAILILLMKRTAKGKPKTTETPRNENDDLRCYIEKALDAGHDPNRIIQSCVDAGWPLNTVQASLLESMKKREENKNQ